MRDVEVAKATVHALRITHLEVIGRAKASGTDPEHYWPRFEYISVAASLVKL